MSERVADAHVDVLMRMVEEGLSFDDGRLSAGHTALTAGGVGTQVFALFVWPHLSPQDQLEQVLRELDCFYRQVVTSGTVEAVRTWQDAETAMAKGRIAGLLSLEGGGCLHGQVHVLRNLYDLGVRGMGLTWNDANELADGCREPRGAGLTRAGREVVRELVRLGMWVDIAHLSDRGVYDVFDLVDAPVMASHANARAVYNHPRNLNDDVIQEVVRRNGWIGLTFEASFLGNPSDVTVDDALRHLEHLLELGAEDCVGFGSDFDGTSHPVPGLSSAADYGTLRLGIAKRYGENVAAKVCAGNFERYLRQILS
ncbi:dipeptidase [Alicyclobacillus sp. ALC3]|uniref:dipeptidase n=1 Tax=Alicyclobacillus sp. ALC3 TaxID=2796143 RepID=UPI0023783761|nr:membrane dipeptidase [Alicyclobacillus sp. ALC3]